MIAEITGHSADAAPDGLWVGDITYIRTWEGWRDLATVIDVFSRRVIGFALADHMRASLVCDALKTAVATRSGTVDDVIFHSDRGSQYSSAEFRALSRSAISPIIGTRKYGRSWYSRRSRSQDLGHRQRSA